MTGEDAETKARCGPLGLLGRSLVVATPVAGPLVFPAGPLPRDVWPLVWGHLPVQGLLAVSHTCRGWRADVVEISRLWAHLDLHAYDSNDGPGALPPTFLTAETRSNVTLIEKILPRSHTQLLTLYVEVRAGVTDELFQARLVCLLELIAPRLAVLCMATADPSFPGETLCEYTWFFPELRVLNLSPSAARENSNWEATFSGRDMPQLRQFALHGDFRLYSDGSEWVNLRSLQCTFRKERLSSFQSLQRRLQCTVHSILNIELLLLAARELQQLRCECLPELQTDRKEVHWPNRPLFDALSRIPDVHVAAVLEPSSVDWIFDFLVDMPRPRLIVEFVVDKHEGFRQLKLKACAQFAPATRLTMRRGSSGDSIIVQPEDGSGSFFQIVLKGLPSDGLSPLIDWGLVPALDALTALHVDAALWPAVMHRFPRAPLLTDATLVLRRADDIGVLLRDGLAAQVPRGATLTLTSQPIVVTVGQVADPTAALGVKGSSMTGSVELASS